MAVKFSNRAAYAASGKVDWQKFLPWAVLTLGVAVVLAYLLNFLFQHGFYLVLIVPVLAALAMAGMLWLAVDRGHCRSPLLGALMGVIAAAIIYLGYFLFGMIQILGPDETFRSEFLPLYIRFRMETDVIRDTHSSDDHVKPPGTGGVFVNWGVFAVEWGIILLVAAGAGVRRARKPYCEGCQRWMERELAQFTPDAGVKCVEALQSGSASSLADVFRNPGFAGFPNAMVAVHYCSSLREWNSGLCPVFLSIKNVTAAPKGAVLDTFQSSEGKLLVDRAQLESNETPALAPWCKVFSSGSGAVADSVQAAGADDRPVKRNKLVNVQAVDPALAGRVLTRKTAWVRTALSFLSIAGVFGPIGMVALGAYIGFPDKPPVGGVAPEAKAFGAILLGAAAVIFVGNMVMLFVNPTLLPSIYLARVVRREFGKRTHYLVSPDDPEAQFVHVVPRLNWKAMMLSDATDAGFLCVDRARREILFEGDREYYRVPAEAIVSCEVESYVTGEGGHGATPIYMVVLRAQDATGVWEAPFMQKSSVGKAVRKKREKWARDLQTKIQSVCGGATAERW